MSSSKLRSELTPEKGRVRAGETHRAASIEQGAHQALPAFDFLDLIQKYSRVIRGELVDESQQSGKVVRRQLVEPGVFQIAIKQVLVVAHQLRLQNALAGTSHSGEDQ